MKVDMDKVQFEYRSEIDAVSTALEEWLEMHKNDRRAKDVAEMIDKLEVMYLSW